MSDRPHFPPPEDAKPKTTVAAAPAPRIVIERPEPISEPVGTRVELTPDEMRALLAVEGALRPTPLVRVWRRGRIILIPTGFISAVGHYWIGGWADLLALVLTVGALVWSSLPLFRRDAWS